MDSSAGNAMTVPAALRKWRRVRDRSAGVVRMGGMEVGEVKGVALYTIDRAGSY
jgi:hypothetical protein